MAHVSHKLSNSLEGALAGGGDPATSPLYVFGPFLKLIVVAGVAQITFGASIWLVVLTITLVSAMYRLVMIWIVDGSGGSGLSEEEFGSWAVKLNASITFVEYTLTFLVSMAALVTFITDRFPVLNEPLLGFKYRTVVAIGLSIATGWLVNRGPKVAARAFGPATAGVLLLLWTMVIATILKQGFQLPSLNLEAFKPGYLKFTLGGYVRILAVMTGIEVFANLVAAYEGVPRRKSALAFRSLLIIMGTTSVTMLVVGPAILNLSDPANPQVSVFTQTMDRLLPPPLAFLGTLVGVLVLLSACAASAQGLQNLALGLKLRHYVPAFVGQRNAYEVAGLPVWIEVGIVSFCFLAFGTNEETYLAIYAAGVFILLSMTGWAAAKRLSRQIDPSAEHHFMSLVGTALAALLTSFATIIIFTERFAEGAWAYFVFLPILYLVFTYFRRHLGEPTPVEERRGLLFSEQRYLPTYQRLTKKPVARLEQILLPLDGSAFAEQALPIAQAVSKVHDGHITLIAVHPTESASRNFPRLPSLQRDGELKRCEPYLQQIASQLEATGIRTKQAIVSGDVAEAITLAARDRHADLLVMSTHGRSGVGRMLVGSIAGKVLQGSTIPVLLIRPDGQVSRELPILQKVLVALDGSVEAEQVIPYAKALANGNHSQVLLLSVPDELESTAQVESLKEYLRDVAASFSACGLEAQVVVTGSDPAYTILEMADSDGVDLIMLAARSRDRAARLMFGSVADTVVRKSRHPVFLVPVRQ